MAVCIGEFVFPESTTWWRSTLVEALSKERREIVVESIIPARGNPVWLERQVEDLHREVERLDKGDTTISVHAGRFFLGRRRELSVALAKQGEAARVRLTVLTLDRFERSEAVHEETIDFQPPTNTSRVLNRGNHPTPPVFELESAGSIEGFQIGVGSERLSYAGSLESGDQVLLDCENHRATLNGETNVAHLLDAFPWLPSGWSRVEINVSGSGEGSVTVSYRDLWV